jgi:hypothetical protein
MTNENTRAGPSVVVVMMPYAPQIATKSNPETVSYIKNSKRVKSNSDQMHLLYPCCILFCFLSSSPLI